jgi:uncharacterized protein (DUF433 family)
MHSADKGKVGFTFSKASVSKVHLHFREVNAPSACAPDGIPDSQEASASAFKAEAILNKAMNPDTLLSMKYADRITFNPNQCGGRPCIRGMRIRVKDVLEMLAANVSESEILQDFPYLQPEDIRACLEYAAQEVDHPVLVAAR